MKITITASFVVIKMAKVPIAVRKETAVERRRSLGKSRSAGMARSEAKISRLSKENSPLYGFNFAESEPKIVDANEKMF